jgi:hypothetical protein
MDKDDVLVTFGQLGSRADRSGLSIAWDQSLLPSLSRFICSVGLTSCHLMLIIRKSASRPGGARRPGRLWDHRHMMGWAATTGAVGERTQSGKPITANDMHLQLTVPGIWYENHLSGGGVDLTGHSFQASLAWSQDTQEGSLGFYEWFSRCSGFIIEAHTLDDLGTYRSNITAPARCCVLRETIAIKGQRRL